MKILLIEDNEKLGSIIVKVLKNYHYEVDWAKDGIECFEYIEYSKENPYDVILLDWMLPNKNGDIICKELREIHNFTGGIIFLTARDSMNDIVKGLDVGADDYIVKPFENIELIARINSVNRRKNKLYIGDIVTFGNLTLNKKDGFISANDKSVKLSRIELLFFDLFFCHQNKIVSRDLISENVWGINEDVSQASIDSYIYMLRKKLKSINANIVISLTKQVGYKMEFKK